MKWWNLEVNVGDAAYLGPGSCGRSVTALLVFGLVLGVGLRIQRHKALALYW